MDTNALENRVRDLHLVCDFCPFFYMRSQPAAQAEEQLRSEEPEASAFVELCLKVVCESLL